MKGYVYFFVASVDGGYRVKIGHTRRSPLQRLLDIQPGSPVDMEIFGYFHGDVPLEKKFHRTFDSLRIHNEWFVGEHKLLDFVWYLAGYGAAKRPCTWDEVECAIHDNILAECAPNPNIDEAAYLASADMSEWRELAKQWA